MNGHLVCLEVLLDLFLCHPGVISQEGVQASVLNFLLAYSASLQCLQVLLSGASFLLNLCQDFFCFGVKTKHVPGG